MHQAITSRMAHASVWAFFHARRGTATRLAVCPTSRTSSSSARFVSRPRPTVARETLERGTAECYARHSVTPTVNRFLSTRVPIGLSTVICSVGDPRPIDSILHCRPAYRPSCRFWTTGCQPVTGQHHTVAIVYLRLRDDPSDAYRSPDRSTHRSVTDPQILDFHRSSGTLFATFHLS